MDIQRTLAAHTWPDETELRVRIGIHSGEAAASGERYLGLSVHRAARIGAAAHGGQVLLSDATRVLVEDDLPVGVSLRDLGSVRLKDIDRPERISQLAADGLRLEFPPLRGAEPIKSPPILRRRSLWAAMLAGVVAAAIAIPVFTLGGSGSFTALASVGPDAVGTLDPGSGRITRSIPVGASPASVAVGLGSVWVANTGANTVTRIDPKTNATQTIPVDGGPVGIVVGGGFVWVVNSLSSTVSKIDPRIDSVIEPIPVGNDPTGIAYGEGGVWVANSSDGTVTRIDPQTGTVARPITVDAGADAIAVGGGAVWVTSQTSGSVAKINPRSGTVQPINVGGSASTVAFGAGAVWIANSLGGTVSRVDPVSDSVVAIPVGDGLSGLAVSPDGRSVWVSNELAGTLSRIDPAERKVVRTVKTENRPEGVAATADAVYVAVQASGLAHRGGTLTVDAQSFTGSIDPALSWDTSSIPAVILTNDGLVAYRHVGGSNGSRLVPDLATSLPTPTDEGKTYTFQLHHNLRYSTGAPVRPADLRRAIERALILSQYNSNFFGGIVGAQACVPTRKQCNLSQGIVTDPTANTVTFHLTAPDPDFLYKLATTPAFAVPADTPLKARLPLPATGPYKAARYNPKLGIRLVRNPRFREWSRAAQPDGFPQQILYRIGISPGASVDAVERGRSDLARDDAWSASGLRALRQRGFASQLHVNPAHWFTIYLFLNTRLPPFNDVRVRQAVNYAVDRQRMVRLLGGSDLFRPTCQVLPPSFAGYRHYCPYAFNLAKARRLVAASGTQRQAVTVWPTPPFLAPETGKYFVSVLQSLGYKARLRPFKARTKSRAAAGDSRNQAQTGMDGWLADYPSAANFFSPLLTCGSFIPRSRSNANDSEFCNRLIDAEIAHARSLQISNPQGASQLWARIDRQIVDHAPWLALANGLNTDFVSRRVGNYTYNPQWGALLDQLWVR